MYGKVAGKLRPQDVISASQTALPTASQAALEAGQEMGAEGAGLVFGRGDAYSGLRLTAPPRLSPVSATGTDLSQVALDFDPATAISKNLNIGTVIPENIPGAEIFGDQALDSSFNQLDDFSSMVLQPTEDAYQASLADAISLGEENALLDAARTAKIARSQAVQTSDEMQRLIDYLNRGEEIGFVPFGRNAGLPLGSFEDGGLIGMQNGGPLTAEGILREQGLKADDKQLALFQAFDPSGIQRATEGAGQSLLGMTGGQGLASAGGGFGAQQSAISQMVEQGQKSLEQQIQEEQKAFESQTLGTAAQIVAGEGEFETIVDPPETPSYNTLGLNVTNPYQEAIDNANLQFNQTNPDGTSVGETATDSFGNVFRWNGTEWVYSSEG